MPGSGPFNADPADHSLRLRLDVKECVDLYGKGWTLRQIAAQLGLTETTVSDHLRSRRGHHLMGSRHPASTQQILAGLRIRRQSVGLKGLCHSRACFSLSSCVVLRVIHFVSGSRATT